MNEENVVYRHTRILLSLKREGNPIICDNVDEPGQHYAKYSKSGTECQILCDQTHM